MIFQAYICGAPRSNYKIVGTDPLDPTLYVCLLYKDGKPSFDRCFTLSDPELKHILNHPDTLKLHGTKYRPNLRPLTR